MLKLIAIVFIIFLCSLCGAQNGSDYTRMTPGSSWINYDDELMETSIRSRILYPTVLSDDSFVTRIRVLKPEPNYDIAIRTVELPENTTRAVVRVSVFPGPLYRQYSKKPVSVLAREEAHEANDRMRGRLGQDRKTNVFVAGTFAGTLIPKPVRVLGDGRFQDPLSSDYLARLPDEVDVTPYMDFLKEGTEIRVSLDHYRIFKMIKYYDHDIVIKLVTWELVDDDSPDDDDINYQDTWIL